MKISRNLVLATTILVIAALLALFILPDWRLHMRNDRIESRLLVETPLGSSEEQVLSHLHAKGLEPKPLWRGDVAPNTLYPPNTIAGSSFLRVLVGEYGLVFITSVEGYYIFDQDGRLIEIAIRKTKDAF